MNLKFILNEKINQYEQYCSHYNNSNTQYIILKKNISKFDSIETKEEPKDAAPEEAKPEEAKPEEKPAEETPAKEPEETEEKEQAREDTIQVTQKIYKKKYYLTSK